MEKMQNSSMHGWLNKQRSENLLSNNNVEKLLEDNESKEYKLSLYNLPTFASTGSCQSFEESLSCVPDDRWNAKSFYVRCSPKDNKDKLSVQRIRGVGFDSIPDFVNNLPGGKDKYSVEIREYWEPDYSGTIISDGKGSTVIEQIKGAHANIDKSSISDLDNNKEKQIKAISLNASRFDMHFSGHNEPSDKERMVMLGALKYFISELNREELEQLRIYAEYSYKEDNGYKFLDVADNDYWTKLQYDK